MELYNFPILYKKTKNGSKIQQWEINVDQNSIYISQGLLDGKKQNYCIKVKVGHQGRTKEEQALLEAQSRFNDKRDEGYKSAEDVNWDDRVDLTLHQWLLNTLPIDKTDANGVLKPMKCTPIEKGIKKIIFPAFAQRKLDGVRCFISYDHNKNEWIATSSNGKDYSSCARSILLELNSRNGYHVNTDFIFDGELYIHGLPLEYLSGLARTVRHIHGHQALEFHIFDFGIKEIFSERLELLKILESEVTPYNNTRFKFVETVVVNSMEEFNAFHDKVVAEGYEGAILRNADNIYQFGVRSTSIFKKKDFKDEEFEIVGMELGSRGTEDMVFVCIIKNGDKFKANPIGNRQRKDFYWNNKETIIGKEATVRYLTLSQNGIPQGNPIMKVIRDYE